MIDSKPQPRERRYRRHWSCLIGKVLIGLLGLAAVVGTCTIVDLHAVPWLPALALIPIAWLAIQVLWWRSTYLCFENNRLVFHRGLFDLERHINYNFGDWTFEQKSLWAKLLDFGTLQVGQLTFEKYWPFHQLSMAVRTPQEPTAASPQASVPPAGPSAFPGQPVFVFVPIRERVIVQKEVVETPAPPPPALSPWEGNGYLYNDIAFEAEHPSYAGFLAACEEFLLPGRRLDLDACVSHDSRRRYYPGGMSRHVALFYRELLERARIIDDEGLLFRRIRDIEDIRQRIPYFEVPRRLAS